MTDVSYAIYCYQVVLSLHLLTGVSACLFIGAIIIFTLHHELSNTEFRHMKWLVFGFIISLLGAIFIPNSTSCEEIFLKPHNLKMTMYGVEKVTPNVSDTAEKEANTAEKEANTAEKESGNE